MVNEKDNQKYDPPGYGWSLSKIFKYSKGKNSDVYNEANAPEIAEKLSELERSAMAFTQQIRISPEMSGPIREDEPKRPLYDEFFNLIP